MAYNNAIPANDGFIADAPTEIRTNTEGLRTEQIVDAGKLKGLSPGNASGNIPISNGTVNTNLNAQLHGGNLPSAYATAGHVHSAATTSANGFMSNTDKTKLDGVSAGAEVNQNAFATIVAGGVSAVADSKTDTFTINAGAGIAVTGDAANDACTIGIIQDGHSHIAATTSAAGFISAADKVKLDGITAGAEVNQNAFSTIVAGGVSAVADAKQDTFTINAGAGITITGDAANDACTIAVTANGHTHTDATTSAAGFITAAMVTKLNGIATGAQTNQNAFSNVLVGSTTVAADSATDTLELIAGANITLTPDAANDRVTFAVSGKVPTAAAADTAAACTGNSTTATTAGTCTGNSATATKLAAARTINGVAFDGSGNIAITAAANGGTSAACSGNAATATKLANARTITLGGDAAGSTTFDGSGNVTINVTVSGEKVVPSGTVIYTARNTAPTGYLKANGAAISRTTYAALFAAIGTTYGVGDGTTTFNVPDLRGEFIRALDDGRGVDTSRGLGSIQTDAGRNITGYMRSSSSSGDVNTQFVDALQCDGAFAVIPGQKGYTGDSGGAAGQAWGANFDASRVWGQEHTASEFRPRNVALLACIKY